MACLLLARSLSNPETLSKHWHGPPLSSPARILTENPVQGRCADRAGPKSLSEKYDHHRFCMRGATKSKFIFSSAAGKKNGSRGQNRILKHSIFWYKRTVRNYRLRPHDIDNSSPTMGMAAGHPPRGFTDIYQPRWFEVDHRAGELRLYQLMNKIIGFGQRPRPLHSRYSALHPNGHFCPLGNGRYMSVPLIRVGPPVYFIHISITTPVVSALKNYYMWSFLEFPTGFF